MNLGRKIIWSIKSSCVLDLILLTNYCSLLNIQYGKKIQSCEIPLLPKIKLAATIRFLATGASYADLQHLFRVHKSTLSKIIPEVCEAIYSNLKKTPIFEGKFFFLSRLMYIVKKTGITVVRNCRGGLR